MPRSLLKRGRRGGRLITSDALDGLKQAIATVLGGATWQRCRVHFMRNLLATVPKGAREARHGIATRDRNSLTEPGYGADESTFRERQLADAGLTDLDAEFE